MKKEIEKLIQKAVGVEAPSFLVEVPAEATHGDYSTNIALVLSKKLGKNPREIANEIVVKINHAHILENVSIEKVEVAGAGFINFYLSKEYFVGQLKSIEKNVGKNSAFKNKKIIVEFTDPNILKDFHIGHLMSNSIGESISRIIEFSGAKIKRVTYQSDVSLGIAKAVFGKMKNSDLSWQESYVFGVNAYNESENDKAEITALNKKIFERSDRTVNSIYDEGKKWSLAYFEAIYKKLGSDFDDYFMESQVADIGKKIVLENVGKVFEKGEKGAIIFKGEKFGLHTRVFINSEGLPTYEAKDLALPIVKYKKYPYDSSIIITANEQTDYFKVMLCALGQINPALFEKTKHIGHGMMRLPEGKMSSRTGKVITFEFLLSEVEKLVAKKIAERDLSEAEKKEIIEKVAIGALKYSILKQSTGSDIIYDFEKSVSFEGDSGPYLQYAYARAQSILRKAKTEKIKASFKKVPENISQLEKMMNHFSEIVEKAGKELEPHGIAIYLTELAREFNHFYAQNKIVDKTDEFSPYKVAIVEAFSQIMKNGLWLLGIEAPDKM